MRTNGARWLSACLDEPHERRRRRSPTPGRVARRSKASPALAVPLRTGPPRRARDAGSGSPVSADSSTTASALATIAVDRDDLAGAHDDDVAAAHARRPAPPRRASSTRRCAIRGARSTQRASARVRARRRRTSSSALPPASIRATTAPARYSPSASAPAIATQRDRVDPDVAAPSERATDQVSGTRTTAAPPPRRVAARRRAGKVRSPPTPIAAA